MAENSFAVPEMADESSLWSEVRRLIALRRSTPALGVNAAVEFVYCEKNAYPLVYLRSVREEGGQRVLVALNPAQRPAEVACDGRATRTLYSLGEAAELAGGTLRVPACSATFIELA